MMTLIHLLPFIMESYVETDDHWECFLALWDICSIASAFEVTEDDVTHLTWLVEIYLEFIWRVNNSKMHYLVHLPQQIIR